MASSHNTTKQNKLSDYWLEGGIAPIPSGKNFLWIQPNHIVKVIPIPMAELSFQRRA